MKWPEYLMLIRHDVSVFNILKTVKNENSIYQKFLEAFEKNPKAHSTKKLAKLALKIIKLDYGDCETPLANNGMLALETGRALKKNFSLPDVVFVSPYKRTQQTLSKIKEGWSELERVKTYEEERLREQEHGLALLYNDWRILHALDNHQRELFNQEGRYWYRYPQGENVPDVRLRNGSWIATLIREFSEKKVLVITHHLNILAMRANFERLSAEEFVRLDEEEKPVNCGVTLYRGNPNRGKDGKLELDFYNKKYYSGG